ncbi:5449_t:CDS:2 [Entrophospora sp. SA101]|nr:5449_t:CDS:2 [Entrophospora sp. SA101]
MDYQSYDNNDLINGTNNQGPNRVLHSNGETNFTGSAPIQNNQNADNSVGPNSMVQIGVNNQNFNLVSHPNGQTNFTGSASIQNNQNVEFTDFIHESFVYNNFNQQDTFNNISVGQNSMILTDANNNNYNNVSTAYQGSQITNTYQNDQIVISRQQLLDIVNQLPQLDDNEFHLLSNPPCKLYSRITEFISANPNNVDYIGITKSPNSFFFYRKNYIAKHKSSRSKKDGKILSKEAGDAWNNESDEVKSYFKALAKLAREKNKSTYDKKGNISVTPKPQNCFFLYRKNYNAKHKSFRSKKKFLSKGTSGA